MELDKSTEEEKSVIGGSCWKITTTKQIQSPAFELFLWLLASLTAMLHAYGFMKWLIVVEHDFFLSSRVRHLFCRVSLLPTCSCEGGSGRSATMTAKREPEENVKYRVVVGNSIRRFGGDTEIFKVQCK